MKKIGLIFSLFIVLMCSGCGPILEPLIEGTYTSYNEEKNETFSKGKFTIKEITKEEYEEAKGINVFIDGYIPQKDEKRYLLKMEQASLNYATIPAVKRGDKFLNLMDMKEFEYVEKSETYKYPYFFTMFPPKSFFDL